jgi:hypothetical protein
MSIFEGEVLLLISLRAGGGRRRLVCALIYLFFAPFEVFGGLDLDLWWRRERKY